MLLAIRKTALRRIVLLGMLVIVLHLLALDSLPALAQIGNQARIRSITLIPGFSPDTQLLAMIAETPDPSVVQIIAGMVPPNSGQSLDGIGSIEFEAASGDLADADTGYAVGNSRFVSLLDGFNVHNFELTLADNGSMRITGPTTQGPFGDPAVHGRPTSFAVLPQPRDPTGPWFAIGTDTGSVILAKSGIEPCIIPVGGSVVGFAVVPQVGYFAVVALVNGRDGQHLVGIRPPDTSAGPPTPAQIVFDLTQAPTPGSDTPAVDIRLVDVFNGSNDSPPGPWDNFTPLSEPAPAYLIAANGTPFLHRLTIPAVPTIGGTFRVRSLAAADSPIAQAAVGSGSLALLPVDGAGVVYDPGFRVGRGGVSGKLLTIFGSSLEVRPRRLSLQGRRRFVTVFIEVANDQAAHIDRASIGVRIGAADLGKSAINAQLEPDDSDHDGNLDLEVNLDRSAVQSLIAGGATSLTITAHWRFSDGSRGSASAEISIKSQGDDDDEVEDSD